MGRDSLTCAKMREFYRRSGGLTSEDYNDLKIITCNLPELDLAFIDKFIIRRIVPSRSEYIRVALRRSINMDIELLKIEDDIVDEKIKLDPEKFVRVPGYNRNRPVKIIRRLD